MAGAERCGRAWGELNSPLPRRGPPFPPQTPSGPCGPCHPPQEGTPGSHLLPELSLPCQPLLGLLREGRGAGGGGARSPSPAPPQPSPCSRAGASGRPHSESLTPGAGGQPRGGGACHRARTLPPSSRPVPPGLGSPTQGPRGPWNLSLLQDSLLRGRLVARRGHSPPFLSRLPRLAGKPNDRGPHPAFVLREQPMPGPGDLIFDGDPGGPVT